MVYIDDIFPYLKQLYPDDADWMIAELKKELRHVDEVTVSSEHGNWYKRLHLYVTYPDSFPHPDQTPIQGLTQHIDHIKQLGCNAVHILPFLQSPLVDKGFDISDYYSVRSDFGTLKDIDNLVKKAHQQDLHVFMDLVLNHVSEKHSWSQKAVAGDEKYRKYFITTEEKPKFIRKYHKDSAVWAEYEVDGEIVSTSVVFPEHAGDIPHWILANDGYWYYHTYYPQQPDVNWHNPEVFMEFANIIIFWARKRFNFRLDAVTFVGKKAYKKVDADYESTFSIITALNIIAKVVHPDSVCLAETYEQIETVIQYFGTTKNKQVELAYHFHLSTALWVSLVTKNVTHLWETIDTTQHIPPHAEWINFLRNHDELSLSYLDDTLKMQVTAELMENGMSFREGFGISGRTYSLLGQDMPRFLMAYFLLFSLPSTIAIPYGDELAAHNIPIYKVPILEQHDTRNIHRGRITQKLLDRKKSQTTYQHFQKMLHNRASIQKYLRSPLERYPLSKQHADVFAAKYSLEDSHMIVLVNLSDAVKEISLPMEEAGYTVVSKINGAKLSKNTVILKEFSGIWLEK